MSGPISGSPALSMKPVLFAPGSTEISSAKWGCRISRRPWIIRSAGEPNIWANRFESGAIVYNVTFDRIWKENDETNGQGEVTKKGEWKQSASFGKDDLLLLGKIA